MPPSRKLKPGTRTSEVLIGLYVPCPGAHIHGPLALPVRQGRKAMFADCPLYNCCVRIFLKGPGWRSGANTMDVLRRANPGIVAAE